LASDLLLFGVFWGVSALVNCTKAPSSLPEGGEVRYNLRLFRVRILTGTIMVVIRLARGGAKKRPFYNIVATDSRNRRDGRFIERIGFYNPVASGAAETLSIKQDRLTHWQSVGAQLSPTVERLVKAAGKKAA
jgi:small subunit ribosomal protein S16